MISPTDAEQRILALARSPLPSQYSETVDLQAAVGRVLAAPVTSQLDFPHWDNSAMDGYAVRFTDVSGSSIEHPVTLKVVMEIPAGVCPDRALKPGEAARIFTGAMMPPGADTVVMQEETQRQGDRVTLLTTPQSGAFVRYQGAYYRAGAELLAAGIRVQAAEIAILAAAQCSRVQVFRRPRVAILSTGNELVLPDQPLQAGQIVDSNQYALAALVAQAGAEPLAMGIVPDSRDALRDAIQQSIATADVILSSGGVSVGDYDYIAQILAEFGAEIAIQSVAMKPGKPLTVAVLEGNPPPGSLPGGGMEELQSVLYFGLPGNPASAMVTFWRFVQPALKKLSGVKAGWLPVIVKGRSRHPLKAGGKRETYLWGQVQVMNGKYEFSLADGSHLSGNLINLAQTNSLAILPIGTTEIPVGDPVDIMLV
jgi:molybdopterin molybdotransferase